MFMFVLSPHLPPWWLIKGIIIIIIIDVIIIFISEPIKTAQKQRLDWSSLVIFLLSTVQTQETEVLIIIRRTLHHTGTNKEAMVVVQENTLRTVGTLQTCLHTILVHQIAPQDNSLQRHLFHQANPLPPEEVHLHLLNLQQLQVPVKQKKKGVSATVFFFFDSISFR